jgi:hypothetical protein
MTITGMCVAVADLADHFEAAHFGHLEIQQDQVRVPAGDLLQRGCAVVRLANYVDAAYGFQILAQDSCARPVRRPRSASSIPWL